ncbi:hypothetical protein P154DRAFT_524154 [Amniculicola lignicola CBS 123094]|uniref:DUF7924 domain-containing protein n=1 Tax=Amniculicola lignicola CBS 123094 TaxID=1392246 RepID=A0A6A5WKM1_9PLEO|nr:hypothetical protein P154DRAFT_524154 [Amniculicola lignicola CBS 123094]
MKRASYDSDSKLCNVSHKRRRLSLPATCAAPTTAKWAGVMGWLHAVPRGTSAEEARPNPHHHEDSKIPLDSILTMECHPRPQSSNPSRREKKTQIRKRSDSPTKKPGEYRSILLSEASIFIDREFAPPSAAPNLESLTVPPEMQNLVDDIAKTYCEECRESAMSGSGEGSWRANASVTVMSKLRRFRSFAEVLKVNGSGKLWQAELKPVRATALPQTTVAPPPFTISPVAVEPKDLGTTLLLDRPYSFSSSAGPIVCPPIDRPPADLASINSDSLSYTSGYTSTTFKTDAESLSTPKPDICVGLAHEWFPTNHQSTLNYLKTDPHTSAMGLHFPFLIFEAKGNAGLFGAQNQAAVGAACMLRILDLIHCGEDRVVWSVTTEGPIHELWAHYRDGKKRYQSVHMNLWRMTKMEHAKAFVEAMAKIMIWGSGVFGTRVLQALDGVRQFEGS